MDIYRMYNAWHHFSVNYSCFMHFFINKRQTLHVMVKWKMMVQLSPFIICNNQGSARYLIFWHETPDCGRQFFLFQYDQSYYCFCVQNISYFVTNMDIYRMYNAWHHFSVNYSCFMHFFINKRQTI
jgi:hypothetical protein